MSCSHITGAAAPIVAPAVGVAPAATTAAPGGSAQPTAAAGVSAGGPLDATGGAAAAQGVQGAALTGTVDAAALVPVLTGLVTALTGLVTVLTQMLQQQGAAQGGGGAAAAPSAPIAAETPVSSPEPVPAPQPAPAAQPPAPVSGGGGPASYRTVDPSTVKDRDHSRISANSQAGLEEAHRFGLPLISGFRSGNPKSDHAHGNAIDVGTVKIGSDQGTPAMQAYADYMREQGKAGNLNIKYVIYGAKIASSNGGWAWRDYEPPDYKGNPEGLARQSKAEQNRLLHNDHVHVSFN